MLEHMFSLLFRCHLDRSGGILFKGFLHPRQRRGVEMTMENILKC